MRARLIVDARERVIIPHIQCPHEIRTLSTGDYVIYNEDTQPMAIVERKTYPDFVASVIDGRIDNREKLKQFRSTTGCRVIYLIEGEPGCGRISHAALESHIFHLIIRDGICLLYSRDPADTARTLCALTTSVGTLKGQVELEPEMLTAREPPDQRKIIIDMWSTWSGVSKTTATVLAARYTVADIICGRADGLANVRIGTRLLARQVRAGLESPITSEHAVRILDCIPGITLDAGKVVIAVASISDILATDQPEDLLQSCGTRIARCVSRGLQYMRTTIHDPRQCAVPADPQHRPQSPCRSQDSASE